MHISAKGSSAPSSGAIQNRLVSLLNSKASAGGLGVSHPHSAGPHSAGPHSAGPHSTGTNLMVNSSTGHAALTAARHMMPNAPFILNLSQLQGSNGLIILSSQTATPISIINNHLATGSVATGSVEGGLSGTSSSPNTSRGTGPIQENLTQHPRGSVQATLLGTPHLNRLNQEENPHLAATVSPHSSTSLPNTLTDSQMATHQGGNSLMSQFEASNHMTCVTTTPSQTHYDVRSHSLSPRSVGVVQTTDSHSLAEQQMETSVELLQSSQSHIHHPTPGLDGQHLKNNHTSSPHMDTLVSELNVKNELQQFDSLHLTHDEIQETLSANMPKDSQLGQANIAVQNTGSIDSVEPMRTSLVSNGTDLNFDDAFDILDLTDFGQENLGAGLGHIPHSHPEEGSGSPASGVTHLSTAPSTTSNCANCHTDKQETRAGIANITDFSPEWAYTEGGTKVLVTGPWYSTTSPYTVLFDGVKVAATLVQSGVLRCYCPAHVPSIVSLQVACEGYVISNSCLFEYKPREQTVAEQQTEWFGVGEDQVKLAILERLDHIEKRLSPGPADALNIRATPLLSNQSGNTFEDRIIEYCNLLRGNVWTNGNSLITSGSLRLTLLHLAAALGYTKLIDALIKWRSENSSLVLEYEVDGLSIDDHACTPLMWGCARGHLEACMVLYQLNPSALNLCNREGLLPMSVARTQGHTEVVNQLTRLEAASRLQSPLCMSQPTHLSEHQTTLTAPSLSHQTTLTAPSLSQPIFVTSLNTGVPTSNTQTVSTVSQVTITSPTTMTTVFTPLAHPDQAATSPTLWATPAPMEDLTIEIPLPGGMNPNPENSMSQPNMYKRQNVGSAEQRRARLMKRTSVEVLPDYPVTGFIDISKCSKTNEAEDGAQNPESLEGVGGRHGDEDEQTDVSCGGHLRTSTSDPHLLVQGLPRGVQGLPRGPTADPMISMSNRDLNSPVMFMQTDFLHADHGLTLEDLHNDIAMETDSRSPSPLADLDEDTLRESTLSQCTDGSEGSQNQMMTLANQIIAAMPERIKSNPSHSEDLLTDEISARRDRSSSYSSFSSASSSATPPVAEDSGISTPLEGMSFEEYRYPDLGVGTPASSLSPASSCLQSPYSFNLDSPTPTTEEFYAYFNAPSTYMEKDFSQLTLSDDEQRRLYEAAKIIQSFYRRYKDKQDFLQRQRQKEVEAAILIQSYYRRYKQYIYYKKMTQAAVLIQSQFRSYYAQKRFRKSREAATIIQNRYRAYKEHERYKKSRNAAVIIQQRFRSHYQRKRGDKGMSTKVQEMMEGSDLRY